MPNFVHISFFLLCFFTSTNVLIINAHGNGTQLLLVNNCNHPIWPAILPTTGHETLNHGGFSLCTAQQEVVDAPKWWSGRIWARQGCIFNRAGSGSCHTGDCNGQLHCKGVGGQPPVTLVEMTLGTQANPSHYYDVSLVDGFNLPVSVIPVGGGAGCGVAACEADVNVFCPENLVVRRGGEVVACKSACLATRDDRYCCTGEYSKTCKPSAVSNLFKDVCPRAYSYAYDEASGLKSCRAKRYVITFCPPN